MPDVSDLFEADDEGVVVNVLAQLSAGKAEVLGRQGDALHVSVASPPKQERANGAIAALLAHELGVEASVVTQVDGEAALAKHFRVAGVDADTASDLLEQALAAAGRKGPKGRSRF